MISLTTSEAANAMGGQQFGPNEIFTGVSTDSRTVQPGEIFFALKGERFDGHEMCVAAYQQGAVASVVERKIVTKKTCVKVLDTRHALGKLAHYWRNKQRAKLIGITGSNGKTTTKEMLASILGGAGKVLATKGNFNNDIGLPKTLFEMSPEHDFAVIEMGANHIGEIEQLARIANPQVSIITLCAPSHLEGFGSIEGVAKAKGEIFSSLPENGTAIINADDHFHDYWSEVCGRRKKITFGLNPSSADVFATDIEIGALGKGTTFTLCYQDKKIEIAIPHDGRHNVMNALAASAGALAVDCPLEQIATGLAGSDIVSGRLNVHQLSDNIRLIDDTYNSNPSSLMAAVNVAADAEGEHWVVMGDMGELGADGVRLHQQCGRDIAATGATYLFSFGELAGHASKSFGRNGLAFDKKSALSEAVIRKIKQRDSKPLVIVVKGSRFTEMEVVVQTVRENIGAVSC